MKAELFIAKYQGQDTSKRIKKEYTGYGSTEMEALTNLFWEMMDDSRSHFKVAVDEDEDYGYEAYFGENSTPPTKEELINLIIDHAEYYGDVTISKE